MLITVLVISILAAIVLLFQVTLEMNRVEKSITETMEKLRKYYES